MLRSAACRRAAIPSADVLLTSRLQILADPVEKAAVSVQPSQARTLSRKLFCAAVTGSRRLSGPGSSVRALCCLGCGLGDHTTQHTRKRICSKTGVIGQVQRNCPIASDSQTEQSGRICWNVRNRGSPAPPGASLANSSGIPQKRSSSRFFGAMKRSGQVFGSSLLDLG